LNGTGGTTVRLERFYPHPTFSLPPGATEGTVTNFAPTYDIAVMDVGGDTPSIPSLPADTTAFGDGWMGTDVAYGHSAKAPDPFGLKQAAELTSLSLAEFQSRFAFVYPHATGFAHYMVFDGVPRYPGAPTDFYRQIFWGDSGGPLFRWDNGWRVAGINSLFIAGSLNWNPQPMLTFTTRVAKVASWIASSNKIKGAPGSLTNALVGKCLGVNGSTADNAPVVLELCADRTPTGSSQFWSKESTLGGTVKFVNGRSGRCLHKSGTGVVQKTCIASETNQRWLILVGSPSLTPLIHESGAYAGVRDATPFGGPTRIDLGADEATTRMRWIWTQ